MISSLHLPVANRQIIRNFVRMQIGFDAKRAYHNTTGLGYFSRTLINLLARYYPEHDYFLYNPRPSDKFRPDSPAVHEILPSAFRDKLFRSAWRSSWVKKDLLKQGIDLYHGLSHELPMGIEKTGIRTVVTMHDLIPERFPEQFKPIDVAIYKKKYRHACRVADHIMAISEQTKQDIIDYYQIPAERITVCYQSVDPAFAQKATEQEKAAVRVRYGLPEKFFLYVGTVIERKNLLNICKAMFLLRGRLDIPLVVVGKGGKYLEQVKDYIRQQNLEKHILFVSETAGYVAQEDFPAIYQMSTAMLYPSFFEGFGIPVLEAHWSSVPVITSNVSCLPEVGGPGAYYVDPNSSEEIAEGMYRTATDGALVQQLLQLSDSHIQRFTPEVYVKSVMSIYEKVMRGSSKFKSQNSKV